MPGLKEALYWKSLTDQKVQCELCPHRCNIAEGKRGICGVRENVRGRLYSLVYGRTTGAASDPIEKKPLFHFYPGSDVLSFGTVGCNLKCLHCQNFTTSQVQPDLFPFHELELDEIPQMAKRYGCRGVAWTYNEPTIWYEFTLEGSKLAKQHSLYTVYVTNGYINPEPLKELAPVLDAMNIDVKAFTEDFYRKISRARLAPVLETCELAVKLGIHVELTYLVIPTYNDARDEIRQFCDWVAGKLGKDIPIHFSRFHPDYKLTNVPSTPISTLELAYETAKNAGLRFVYIGNVFHTKHENTFCPRCNKLLVERIGFSVGRNQVRDGKCFSCFEPVYGVWK